MSGSPYVICAIFMTDQSTEELLAEAEDLLQQLHERDIVLRRWRISAGKKLGTIKDFLKRRKEQLLKEICVLTALLLLFLLGLYRILAS